MLTIPLPLPPGGSIVAQAMTTRTNYTSAASMRRHLDELYSEQAAADLAGLLRNDTYRSYLEGEIALMQNAFVAAAVTEIAILRARLDGPLHG